MIRLTTTHSKRRIYLALKDLLSNHSDGKVLTSIAKVIKRAEIVNFHMTCLVMRVRYTPSVLKTSFGFIICQVFSITKSVNATNITEQNVNFQIISSKGT